MTSDNLLPYLRQYRHNDDSGLVFGYDKEGTDRYFAILLAHMTAHEARAAKLEKALQQLAIQADRFSVSGVYFNESEDNAAALDFAYALLNRA